MVSDPAAALGAQAGTQPNRIHDNALGVDLHGLMLNQSVTDNGVGVSGAGTLGGVSLGQANEILRNGVGVQAFTGAIQYNRIGYNGTGVAATADQPVIGNLIYKNTQVGLEISGVSGVRAAANTIYAPEGDAVRVESGARDAEILSSLLWVGTGYDLYVADDSQIGFFSDYNTLHAEAGGRLVHWAKDYTDILDWQVDLARFDLHSVGRTAINPELSAAPFVDRGQDDYQLVGLVAGQRTSNLSLDAGSPFALRDTAQSAGNLLANPRFDSGLSGWVVSGGASAVTTSSPTVPSYLQAAQLPSSFARQQIDLIAAGLTADQIDRMGGGQPLQLLFGGRIASDGTGQGSLNLSFYDQGGALLATRTVVADEAAGRWQLVGDRLDIPTGARTAILTFEADTANGTFTNSFGLTGPS
ncbi:hypothetical protein [Methylobacterium durans]|uniref:Uncharacterized protein n=1 Tax=Methylobacterium durans TaxID=2202825 RepID=A0A2U8W6R0_9HYPH|nr:hypothetical protein [Methylobacterium durans]AWN41759.1 hypothetical protein DK389_16145 [Methylobacterium durans]